MNDLNNEDYQFIETNWSIEGLGVEDPGLVKALLHLLSRTDIKVNAVTSDDIDVVTLQLNRFDDFQLDPTELLADLDEDNYTLLSVKPLENVEQLIITGDLTGTTIITDNYILYTMDMGLHEYFDFEQHTFVFVLPRQMCQINHSDDHDKLEVKVELIDDRAVVPSKKDDTDAGYDLTLIDVHKELPNGVVMYNTGVKVEPPDGYYFRLHPRSSIVKSGYRLANQTGIIDNGYRGELFVVLHKYNKDMPDLELPCRFAQLILEKQNNCHFTLVNSLSDTNRNEKGFGSSGV